MSATGEPAAGPVHVRRPRAEAGTTLVEALVVVTILSATAAIGFPRLQQGLLALSQRQTVTAVSARLRLAQAEALRRDAPVVFAVAPDGRAYGLADAPATPTPPGVRLETPAPGRIAFFGDGSSNGGQVQVRAAGRSTPVSVAALSGVVISGER